MLNEVINKVERIFQTFFISEYLEDVFLSKCFRVDKKKKKKKKEQKNFYLILLKKKKNKKKKSTKKVFLTFMKKKQKQNSVIIAVSAVHITAKSKSFIYSSEILKMTRKWQ